MGTALLGLGRAAAGEALAAQALAGGGEAARVLPEAGVSERRGAQTAACSVLSAGISHAHLAVRVPGPLATLPDRPRNVVDLWRGVYQPPRNLPEPPQQGGSGPQKLTELVGEYSRIIETFFDAEGHLNAGAFLLAGIRDNPLVPEGLNGLNSQTIPEIIDSMYQSRVPLMLYGGLSALLGIATISMLVINLHSCIVAMFTGIFAYANGEEVAKHFFHIRECQKALADSANIEGYYFNHVDRFVPNMQRAIDEILCVVVRLREHLEHNLAQLIHLPATDTTTITARARYATALERVGATENFFTNLREQLPTLSGRMRALAALASATALENLDPTRVVSEQTAQALFGDTEPLTRTAFELGLDVGDVRR